MKMHAVATMQIAARAFCKMRDLAAGLGVMLVGKGGDDGEAGGASPCSSVFLQSVGVLGRGRCAGVAAAAGGGGRTGGTRGRLRRVGLFRLQEKARMDHGAYPMRRALTRTLELSMLLMPESIGT